MAHRRTVRMAALVTAAAATLALGACADKDDNTAAAPATSAAPAATSEAPAQTAEATTAAAADKTGTATAGDVKVTLDGEEQTIDSADAKCKWGHDDGFPQLEFDVDPSDKNASGELEVEIVMSDPQRLDDFKFEFGADEWKAEKNQRGAADIQVDGDKYTVTSDVTHDDTAEVKELKAEFTCS